MYEELQHYTDALRTYITSTYHVSNPALVDLRDKLLSRSGAVAQTPYLESTPRYAASRRYQDLLLPSDVADLLKWLGDRGVLFDPPYDHQARALELALNPPSLFGLSQSRPPPARPPLYRVWLQISHRGGRASLRDRPCIRSRQQDGIRRRGGPIFLTPSPRHRRIGAWGVTDSPRPSSPRGHPPPERKLSVSLDFSFPLPVALRRRPQRLRRRGSNGTRCHPSTSGA